MAKFQFRRLNGAIELDIDGSKLYITPGQALDLAKNLTTIASANVITVTLDTTKYSWEPAKDDTEKAPFRELGDSVIALPDESLLSEPKMSFKDTSNLREVVKEHFESSNSINPVPTPETRPNP